MRGGFEENGGVFLAEKREPLESRKGEKGNCESDLLGNEVDFVD